MADNPPSLPPKIRPPLPSSGRTGQLKAPTTKLPPLQRTTATGKVVVMLSSVAKSAPAGTQQLPRVPAPVVAPPKVLPTAEAPAPLRQPPPLPPKPAASQPAELPTQPRLSSTTHVKLPPKTAVPSLVSLTGKAGSGRTSEKVAPPLLPSKRAGPIGTDAETKAAAAPPLGGATMPGKSDLKKTGPIILNPITALNAKNDVKRTGVIKMNSPTTEELAPSESIFPQENPLSPISPSGAVPPSTSPTKPPPVNPEGWKRLQPGELPTLPATVDLFAHSQRLERKPDPVTPVGGPKAPAPASPPFVGETKSGPALNPAPVALPPAKPVEPPGKTGVPAVLHVAPPMTEKAHDEPREKLPPPHLPEPTKTPSLLPLAKAPALVAADPAATKLPLPPPFPSAGAKAGKPADPAPAASVPPAKSIPPSAPDSKPALKPAVLPKRSMPINVDPASEAGTVSAKQGPLPEATPAPSAAPLAPHNMPNAAPAAGKIDDLSAGKKASETKDLPVVSPQPTANVGSGSGATTTSARIDAALRGGSPLPAVISEAAPGDKPSPEATIGPAKSAPTAATSAATSAKSLKKAPVASPGAGGAAVALKPAAKPPSALPATRTERAKARRLRAALFFWLLLVPLVAAGLFVAMLYFGRDTVVEGQVIPPRTMSVANEVWIVSNFSEDASGVADDLAKDRVPLQREIQERRDHVQRAQADIASREERIRLIEADVQAAKDEITGLVKKSRDDTQKLWDGEGAQIDAEYQSHLDSLQRSIAQRASSLKLPYQPDPSYPSPEVWANAYRLALYQVPPGVDGVKEHQWVGDQLKGWRDFLKTLDERKEQLREKAAQLKLEPGPKIADLNSHIDDLKQRIQGTQGEEEPIKAELQQAQADLAQAQAADDGLDEKYYKQLYTLPAGRVSYRIPLKPNGRFTWTPDNNLFSEGERTHKFLIFSRAVRGDGRQYWALHPFSIVKDKTVEITIAPGGYLSTKAILRPNLSPDEQEQ